MYRTPIGQEGHRQMRDLFKRFLVLERTGKHCPGTVKEMLRLFGSPPISDVTR
jgi:hypothetical protein